MQGLFFIILEEKHFFPSSFSFLGDTVPYFISMAQLLNFGTLLIKQNAAYRGRWDLQGFLVGLHDSLAMVVQTTAVALHGWWGFTNLYWDLQYSKRYFVKISSFHKTHFLPVEYFSLTIHRASYIISGQLSNHQCTPEANSSQKSISLTPFLTASSQKNSHVLVPGLPQETLKASTPGHLLCPFLPFYPLTSLRGSFSIILPILHLNHIYNGFPIFLD